jgi:hypothetical protein
VSLYRHLKSYCTSTQYYATTILTLRWRSSSFLVLQLMGLLECTCRSFAIKLRTSDVLTNFTSSRYYAIVILTLRWRSSSFLVLQLAGLMECCWSFAIKLRTSAVLTNLISTRYYATTILTLRWRSSSFLVLQLMGVDGVHLPELCNQIANLCCPHKFY